MRLDEDVLLAAVGGRLVGFRHEPIHWLSDLQGVGL